MEVKFFASVKFVWGRKERKKERKKEKKEFNIKIQVC